MGEEPRFVLECQRCFPNNQIMVYLRPVQLRVDGEMPVKYHVALSYGMIAHLKGTVILPAS